MESIAGDFVQLRHVCGDFSIDINGVKSPNVVGKDIFMFVITRYGIFPRGTAEETKSFNFQNYCNPDNPIKYNGWGCATWVIYNENMDYTKCNDLNWNDKLKCD